MSEGSDLLFGIKRGKTVQNIRKIRKIRIFREICSCFATDSLESHCSFLKSDGSNSLIKMSNFE